MRKAMRGNDYGAWLTLLFSLLIAWYFVIGPDLPTNTATENHTYRAAAYAESIREGRLYPRWDATANSGYGAPIPHYTPPGAPYLAALLEVIVTQDTVFAVRLVYALAFLLGAGGVYGLVVRLQGAGPAMIAALLYITSPYFGLTTPHILGDLPATLALGLTPTLLWSLHRLLTTNEPHDLALTTVILAALILVQPKIAVGAAALALIIIGWHTTTKHTLMIRPIAIATIIALLLSSFYWLPALLELHAVQWISQNETNRPIALTWRILLAPYTQLNPAALIPDTPLALGHHLLAVAATSTIVLVHKRHFPLEAALLSTTPITLIIALLLLPGETWLLGLISLCIALATSPALSLREYLGHIAQRWILVLVLLAVLTIGHPAWLPPAPGGILTETNAAARITYQQRGYGQPTVPHGQAYPSTIAPTLPVNNTLVTSYLRDSVSYFVPSNLPRALRVSTLNENTHHARYQVTATTITTLPLLKAAFPGWRATLSGISTEIKSSPANLLNITTSPSVDGQPLILMLRLGTTPIRQIAWILSAIAILLLVITTRRRIAQHQETFISLQFLTLPETRLTTVIFVLSLIIVIFTASPNARFSVRPAPNSFPAYATQLNNRSTAGINLLAYHLPRTTHAPGDNVRVTLYWSTLIAQDTNYYTQITVIGPGVTRTKAQLRHPSGYPTTRWLTNRYVADPHYIRLPSDLPPGDYTLIISLEPCPTDTTACSDTAPTFFSSNGNIIGNALPLPQTLNVSD